jgi:Uma2 family endonuclease
MNSVVEAPPAAIHESAPAAATPQPTRRRWTVAEYHRMGEVGLLSEDERVELIEGDIVEMSPIGSQHAGRVNFLVGVLAHRLFGKAVVAPQNPVVLGTHSEPEPDIAVLRWRDDFYEQDHPGPDDVLLIVEVSESTVRFDRRVKAPLYARHGIPEYWLVDLPARCLEIYREPQDGQYRQVTEHRTGTVSPLALPEVVIDLAALFPAPQDPSKPTAAPAP